MPPEERRVLPPGLGRRPWAERAAHRERNSSVGLPDHVIHPVYRGPDRHQHDQPDHQAAAPAARPIFRRPRGRRARGERRPADSRERARPARVRAGGEARATRVAHGILQLYAVAAQIRNCRSGDVALLEAHRLPEPAEGLPRGSARPVLRPMPPVFTQRWLMPAHGLPQLQPPCPSSAGRDLGQRHAAPRYRRPWGPGRPRGSCRASGSTTSCEAGPGRKCGIHPVGDAGHAPLDGPSLSPPIHTGIGPLHRQRVQPRVRDAVMLGPRNRDQLLGPEAPASPRPAPRCAARECGKSSPSASELHRVPAHFPHRAAGVPLEEHVHRCGLLGHPARSARLRGG